MAAHKREMCKRAAAGLQPLCPKSCCTKLEQSKEERREPSRERMRVSLSPTSAIREPASVWLWHDMSLRISCQVRERETRLSEAISETLRSSLLCVSVVLQRGVFSLVLPPHGESLRQQATGASAASECRARGLVPDERKLRRMVRASACERV